jgi:hypothetical protein
VAGSEVIETRPIKQDSLARRRHWCVNDACGLRWTTYEKNAPDPQFAIHKRERPPGNSAQPTTVIAPSPPQELRETGESRSLSGSDPISSSGPICDPDPSKKTLQIVDRVEKKPSGRITYPGEFEVFWLGISSPRNKGMKSEAFEAWRAKGKPGAEVLIAKWNQYLGSLGDTYPKDVCRWIAKRGWLEDYTPAPPARRNGSDKTANNVAVLSDWLAREEAKERGESR